MSLTQKAFVSLILLSVVGGSAFADSVVVEGPGMKVQNRTGWFGTKSSSYQDALGNTIEQDTGLFGRKRTHTRVFGTEAINTPRETSVVDAQGNPLISTRKTWFHGKETRINGNAMINSFKGILQP